LESIHLINEFVRDMDFSAYQADEKTRAAVERKMQILTEAVIRLEMEGQRGITRNRLEGISRYGQLSQALDHRVSDEIVWNTIQDDLPLLNQIVEKALRSSSSSSPNE
jgi:uncharacterized protein with HEPN domain